MVKCPPTAIASQPRSSSLLPPVDEDPRTKQTEPSHLSLRPELSHLSLPPPNFRFQLLPRLSSASREKAQGRFKYLPAMKHGHGHGHGHRHDNF
ncbi:unnamed protein product [Camellia sinensis]